MAEKKLAAAKVPIERGERGEKGQKPNSEETPKRRVSPLAIGGGTAGVIALAWLLALMAVPKQDQRVPHLEGPFVTKLSKSEIQVNLAGESSKRYLVMSLNAEYFAYDEAYVTGRLGAGGDAGSFGGTSGEDPLYTAMLKDALLRLAATKTRDQVTDPVLIDSFLEDVRAVVDPVLFPVHVGDSHAPMEPDSASGLRSGESILESTLRGLLHEHAVHIDVEQRTIALDDGDPVTFEGRERDLKLENKSGATVYVDVTSLEPEFSGSVPIGVPGKVRRIYRDSFLVQ